MGARIQENRKVPMFAEAETVFFLRLVDAQIEFVKNEKGEVTNLVLHQKRSGH